MPGKAPKPKLTRRETSIFKKTTSVNGRLSLGVARDANTGKLVKIDKLNKFEKVVVANSKKYEKPQPLAKEEINRRVLQQRDYQRKERQNAEMIKRMNKKLNKLLDINGYSVDDVIKNAYGTFIKVASARRGEPISKVNTRAYFEKFKDRFVQELRKEYIKEVGKLKTYDLGKEVLSVVLIEATKSVFENVNLGEEFLERENYIRKNILRKAKRI